MPMDSPLSRRGFLSGISTLATVGVLRGADAAPEPVIDIHQHTNYAGRSHSQLLAHQRAMGITTTILLPAGRPMTTPATHDGKSNGLAAKTGGNEVCAEFCEQHPGEFRFFVNEVTDHPDLRKVMAGFLQRGGIGIGEQKFGVECDSAASQELYRVAEEFRVPVLLHFQHKMYNLGFERFGKMLEKFPKVTFIGHAQTMWGNIDQAHQQEVLYPKGKVTPGGLTDRYLADHANFFADMSAGSGLNALLRDEDHTRGFLERHQDKLLYGSDCNDPFGRGPGCQGAQTLAAIRRMAGSRAVERKILFENARRVLKV